MPKKANKATSHRECRKPHILVVDKDENYGKSIVAALREQSICAKHSRTVDAFLDLNCSARVDLVLLGIDATDPDTLDDLLVLRTNFGEGPGTRIVAALSLAPSSFPHLVEQRGADICILRQDVPEIMVTAVKTELSRRIGLD